MLECTWKELFLNGFCNTLCWCSLRSNWPVLPCLCEKTATCRGINLRFRAEHLSLFCFKHLACSTNRRCICNRAIYDRTLSDLLEILAAGHRENLQSHLRELGDTTIIKCYGEQRNRELRSLPPAGRASPLAGTKREIPLKTYKGKLRFDKTIECSMSDFNQNRQLVFVLSGVIWPKIAFHYFLRDSTTPPTWSGRRLYRTCYGTNRSERYLGRCAWTSRAIPGSTCDKFLLLISDLCMHFVTHSKEI